jgi:hypothetical protein
MGRLWQLEQTLPQNLRDNNNYPNLEFVIIDYNSPDGLEDYIKCNMTTPIQSGRLIYYKTKEPQFFHISHAKNMAHKLATGDIVCNVDADNFTGKGFASYLNHLINVNMRRMIHGNEGGSWGRIGMYKSFFEQLTGYDERLEGWGIEDGDLRDRAKNIGLECIIMDSRFTKYINNNLQDSLKNCDLKKLFGKDNISPCDYASLAYHNQSKHIKISSKNIEQRKYAPNSNGWGKGTVYKNFSSAPIQLT